MTILDRNARVRQAQDFSAGGRTKQSFKAECDIKNIMKRFEKTGMVSHLSKYPGTYADLTGAPEYQEALQIVLDAGKAFEALPAKVRQRFRNDPFELLTFLDDPENEAEAREIGLLPEKAAEPVTEPAPVPEKK